VVTVYHSMYIYMYSLWWHFDLTENCLFQMMMIDHGLSVINRQFNLMFHVCVTFLCQLILSFIVVFMLVIL